MIMLRQHLLLLTFSYTFGDNAPQQLEDETITFDFTEGAELVATIQSDQGDGKNIYDMVEPYIMLLSYMSLGFVIMADLINIGTRQVNEAYEDDMNILQRAKNKDLNRRAHKLFKNRLSQKNNMIVILLIKIFGAILFIPTVLAQNFDFFNASQIPFIDGYLVSGMQSLSYVTEVLFPPFQHVLIAFGFLIVWKIIMFFIGFIPILRNIKQIPD
jgi:hypothetical protein